jgi:hypothetical protein
MADAAEARPLPDEEPVEETPITDDPSATDDSGEDKGKDVSFGTFLTVGPKQFRNVTIIGYDSLRDSVRAVRRSGDSVENIQIPFDEYKTLIEAQRQNDIASGRRPKKTASKAVRGVFGRNITLDGQSAQVIGFDAQTDEILVSDANGRRWLKSSEALARPTVARSISGTPSTATAAQETKILREQGAEIDPDRTAQIQNAFQQGRITIADAPGQKTVGLSVDTNGRVLREVETSLPQIQPARLSYISSSGQSVALDDVDVAIPEITAPLQVNASATTQTFSAPSASIRATRQSLQEGRTVSVAIPVGGAANIAATIATTIPATNTAAMAAVSAAQQVLATYDQAVAARQTQVDQLAAQVGEVSQQINTLQQSSREALVAGNATQASAYERQIAPLQQQRASLLERRTSIEVARINEGNKASEIVEALQDLKPDQKGAIPQEKILVLQALLPRSVGAVPVPSLASAAASLPTPPAVQPRAFAPSIPTRPTNAAPSPAVRTPKALRPLGESLSTFGGQARRAVDFNADQQGDRFAGNGETETPGGAEEMLGEDAFEAAFVTEGGREGYSGPLDLPEAQPQSYVADAEDEPEPADIYGAAEEEGRTRMRQLNRQQGVESQGAVLPEELLPQRPETATIQALPPQSAPRAPAGPSPAELSRAAAFQRATTQAVAAQAQRQDQQQKQSMAERAAGLEQQAENVRRNFSRLVDAFDTAHGFEDVIGLLMTFADLNIRLLMTLFDRKSKIFPKAAYPIECTAIACFDIMVVISLMCFISIPIIIIAALIATVSGASFGIPELFDMF